MPTGYDAVIDVSDTTCRIAVGAYPPVTWHTHRDITLDRPGMQALFETPPRSAPHQQTLNVIQRHLKEAVARVGAKPRVDHLHVALPPAYGLTVQAPLPATMNPSQTRHALRQEAALLTGTETETDTHITVHSVPTPLPGRTSHQWYRAVRLPSHVQARLQQWADVLEADLTVHVRPAVVLDAHASTETGWHLGIGCYGDNTEYALWHATNCAYVYYTPHAPTPPDRAYFATSLLNRLHVSANDLHAVWTYGESVQAALAIPPIGTASPRRIVLPPHSSTNTHTQPAPPHGWAAVYGMLQHGR